ncbi:MAG: shikimate dehydrogenase [Spirochaetia bacterium]
MNGYRPKSRQTFYFIGVTTSRSSIMKVFPLWAEHLKLDAVIEGFDFVPHDRTERYREAVSFIKGDPNSLGGLVTTHKLDLYSSCRDLFDGVGPFAQMLGEVSSISKRGGELWAHAKDPITSGLSLEAFVRPQYWAESGADLCLLGAGGSSLALTLYLINKTADGGEVPRRVIVTNRSERRLKQMEEIHGRTTHDIEFSYLLCPQAGDNDVILNRLRPGSLVINATGLGKDSPGSPLTDSAVFPERGLAWDFNYRGDLVFLNQARAQAAQRDLTVEDGWVYFIHGWTRVMAEVFHIEIPETGPEFDQLAAIAASTRSTT